MKSAARLCFFSAAALFAAGVVLDRVPAGLTVMIGLAIQAMGFALMTMR